MVKSRKDLNEHVSKIIAKTMLNKDAYQKCSLLCNSKYNIPIATASDILAFRKMPDEVSEFILFCILDCIQQVTLYNVKTSDFFTETEMKTYGSTKAEDDKIRFPLKFKMIQIADDQWIGRIDVKQLMKLRKAQMISYNANTQRVMQRVIIGKQTEYLKIALNKSAVNAISESFKHETYISNTITFNVNADNPNIVFTYNEATCELIFKKIQSFDITDGYHRYIAMCQLSDENPKFNYPMELRITNFSEDKANSFIFQEDQKTKMRKVDSDSFNMNDTANIITKRINENADCLMKGMLNRNGGQIDYGEFSKIVEYFYLKGIKKEEERAESIKIVQDIIESANLFFTKYNTYLSHKFSFKETLVMLYVFRKYYGAEDKSGLAENTDRMIQKVNADDTKNYYNKSIRKRLISRLEEFYTGVT